MKKTTDAQKKAAAKYDAANTTQVTLKLNLKTDKDVLDKLSETENRQGYIKSLIREDIGGGYERKAAMVQAGTCETFNNWHEYTGITQEDFLAGLKWVCEDPLDEKGRMTRELGCTRKGELVRVRRLYKEGFGFWCFAREDTGMLWDRSNPSINVRDRI